MRYFSFRLLIIFVVATLLAGPLLSANQSAGEYAASDERFGEVTTVELHDRGVSVTLNLPKEVVHPKTLIIYALPNGNTTAQTIGKLRAAGDSWRYDIQHIGAQTRALRARCPEFETAAVVYLEAEGRSWPSWRGKNKEEGDRAIRELVESLRARLGNPEVIITGHSGGGSFDFGYINAHDEIPDYVTRIAFLDSNYGYSDEAGHGDKLIKWLAGDSARRLVVLAYDDRNIELDGKKVVSDTGGTWRATHRMIERLRKDIELTESAWKDYVVYSAPQVSIYLHRNPENKILHTALVGDRNGYIHALTVGTECENKVVRFDNHRGYEEFIAGDNPASSEAPAIPTPENPVAGSAFIESIKSMSREEREEAIAAQLLAGNIPSFLRSLQTIEVSATAIDGTTHTIQYQVMPDYLAIGTDEDFVRMPMNPHTAQKFLDAYGFVFPTAKMVDDIWQHATVKLEPQPLTEEREAPATFYQHHQLIQEQLTPEQAGKLIAGIKKDVVVTNRLQEKPARVAIYGWHYTTGKPIQPVTIVHSERYVDYSHGVRPVLRMMKVDGNLLPFEEILADPHLNGLLSNEGVISLPRYSPAGQ